MFFRGCFLLLALTLIACHARMSMINRCTLPVNPGKCRGYFLRYAYDSKTDECRPFVYGGCRGNRNNFFTYKECMQRCYLRFK